MRRSSTNSISTHHPNPPFVLSNPQASPRHRRQAGTSRRNRSRSTARRKPGTPPKAAAALPPGPMRSARSETDCPSGSRLAGTCVSSVLFCRWPVEHATGGAPPFCFGPRIRHRGSARHRNARKTSKRRSTRYLGKSAPSASPTDFASLELRPIGPRSAKCMQQLDCHFLTLFHGAVRPTTRLPSLHLACASAGRIGLRNQRNERVLVRTRLAAGGSRIRTFGPTPWSRCGRPQQWDCIPAFQKDNDAARSKFNAIDRQGQT
jgi:hypothetical protein